MRNRLLSLKEEKIIREQIMKNALQIRRLIAQLDLLLNREGHKNDSTVVVDLRRKLDILMAENDTFRKVFWQHMQLVVENGSDVQYEAVRYLVLKLKERNSFGAGVASCSYEIGVGAPV